MGNIEVYEENLLGEEYFDFVENTVNSWKNWIYTVINELDTINSNEIKLLTYFSIIEMMAQEYFDYPERNQQTFTRFVVEFQNKYDFLDLVDPITLYYREEDILSSKVCLEDLQDGAIYYTKDSVIRNKAEEIITELFNKKDETYVEKKKISHRYVDLLYRMRCRLSHEFSDRYSSLKEGENLPYYINCGRVFVSNGQLINDEVWQLKFPICFIKDLCLNCVENYLERCLDEERIPGKNDVLDRKCEMSWYSK